MGVLLVILFVFGVGCQGESGKEKYNQLLQRTLASPSGAIHLEDHEAKRFVLESPRPYDLVLMFTARSCAYCRRIEKAFLEVARVHREHQMYLPRKLKGGETIFKPMFFLVVSLGAASQPFVSAYSVTGFPTLVYSLNSEVHLTDSFERKNYLNQYLWRVTQSEGVVNEFILLRWLNRLSGNNHVQIRQSVWLFLQVVGIVGALLTVLGLLYVYLPQLVLNERVWLFLGLGVFMIGAGGFFSTTTTGAPFIGVKREGPEFIQRGSRSQYGIEGFLITGLMILIAACLIGMIKLLKSKNISNSTLFVSLLVLVLVCLRAISFLEGVFASKNFYNPSFFPPAYYIQGPLTADKGLIA